MRECFKVRDVVNKYRADIEECVARIRRQMTGQGIEPGSIGVQEFAENIIFAYDGISSVSIDEINVFVRSILLRISSKYGILEPLLEDP